MSERASGWVFESVSRSVGRSVSQSVSQSVSSTILLYIQRTNLCEKQAFDHNFVSTRLSTVYLTIVYSFLITINIHSVRSEGDELLL